MSENSISTPLLLPVRVFGPGLPAQGQPMQAQFADDQLQLQDDRQQLHGPALPLSGARLATSGFDGSQWGLDIDTEAGRWRIQLESRLAIDALRQRPPAALAAAIAGVHRRDRRSRGWRIAGLSGIGLFLAAPLLGLLALLLAAAPISRYAVSHISVEREQRLGKLFFGMMEPQLKLIEGPAQQTVAAIGQRLTQGSAYTYHWYVTDDPTVNAFAVAGGYVVVNTGLIERAASAEQLAGVLAHEVEHVELRHTLQSMAHQFGLRAAMAVLMGDVGIGGDVLGKLSQLGFSRAKESEADQHGVTRLIAAEIDPRGLPQMFARMQSEAGMAPPQWLSTHPSGESRIATLEELTRDAPQFAPMPIDWNAVQSSLQPPQTPVTPAAEAGAENSAIGR